MRRALTVVALFVFVCLAAAGQQDAQVVRFASEAVTAPVLLPSSAAVSAPKHCDELDGMVRFAATIDAVGVPHAFNVLEASDRRLVGFATELLAAQRFKPGAIDGKPAAVAVELTAGLHTCAQREKHPAGEDFYRFTLRAHPLIALSVAEPAAVRNAAPATQLAADHLAAIGGSVAAPVPTTLIDPAIPLSRKLPKRGLCLIGLTVGVDGVPQNVRVVHQLEPELDSNAVAAVKRWRFRPALRSGGMPVAVEGTVAASFGYADREPVSFATFIAETPEKVQARIATRDKITYDLEPLNADEVYQRYMPSSRIAGRCLVSLTIDAQGVPQNVHVVKGLDSSVDTDAVAMIEHLRFKPAMDGATPVPVGLIIPVRYRSAIEKLYWRDLFVDGLALAIFFA